MKKYFIQNLSIKIFCCVSSLWVFSVSAQTVENVFTAMPTGAVKPGGWLKHQLDIMTAHSSGHLDEVYDRISKDNGWLGGTGDGGEETPYWLDGAVPLAYLTGDVLLQQKVLAYIEWTIKNQRPSGYFGPITKRERDEKITITPENCADGEDWWPRIIMLKVLKEYFSATGDQRVISCMSSFFKYQLQSLKLCPMNKFSAWAQARVTDNAMMVLWLFSKTKDASLLELYNMLQQQSFHWSNLFYERDWVIDAASRQGDRQVMQRHSVNVAMALKDPSINYSKTGDPYFLTAQKRGFNDLMKLHGLPMGIFSGDEDLHGNEPTQGTELCTVVETMFSLEKMIAVTGDIQYMDALEKITFNALPAQTTVDYNNKQYFQMPNQPQVKKGALDFSVTSANGYSNVFGKSSGYTCCYANMHQGWPKFVENLWYASGDSGLAALLYGPCELKTSIEGKPILIKEDTEFPFGDNISFSIHTSTDVQFPLQLRIPEWCNEATLYINNQKVRSDKGGQLISLKRTWKNNDRISLELPMHISISRGSKNSATIERGPLVYALRMNENWQKNFDPPPTGPGQFYTISSQDPWNYALLNSAIQVPDSSIKISLGPVAENLEWSEQMAPIQLVIPAKKIPEWKLTDGVARQPVNDRSGIYQGRTSSVTEQITLIPYGFTKLRITAFPVVR